MAKRKNSGAEQPDQTAEEIAVDIASETLLGDLMSTLLDEIKQMRDVWQKLPEMKQREAISRIECRCKLAVSQVVGIIAAEARPSLTATVEKVEFKDGIKATLP